MSFSTSIIVGDISTVLDVGRLVASLIQPTTYLIYGTAYIVSRYVVTRYPVSQYVTEIASRYFFGDKETLVAAPTRYLYSVYEGRPAVTALASVYTAYAPPEKTPPRALASPQPQPITPPEEIARETGRRRAVPV